MMIHWMGNDGRCMVCAWPIDCVEELLIQCMSLWDSGTLSLYILCSQPYLLRVLNVHRREGAALRPVSDIAYAVTCCVMQ
jgi:hypothetical protein